jgi:hypothetical protein
MILSYSVGTSNLSGTRVLGPTGAELRFGANLRHGLKVSSGAVTLMSSSSDGYPDLTVYEDTRFEYRFYVPQDGSATPFVSLGAANAWVDYDAYGPIHTTLPVVGAGARFQGITSAWFAETLVDVLRAPSGSEWETLFTAQLLVGYAFR